MILVDTNLLLYAHERVFPRHAEARAWLDGQISQGVRVGMPWASLLGFLRVITNRRALAQPQTIEGAWTQVEDWLAQPSVWIPEAGARHGEILGRLLADARAVADLVPDAHLAALAIEHGLTLCSNDRDFARFPGLRWMNPLV